MKFTKFFQILLVAVLYISLHHSAFAQDIKVASIEGGKQHGCHLRSPTNLLVSLNRKKLGRVLVFKKELKTIAKSIQKTRSSIAAIKNKTDSASKKKRKKLKKTLSNFRRLSKGIIACRDGGNIQVSVIDCASGASQNGTSCDDLNPCTDKDSCQNAVCIGVPISGSSNISCSFGKCAQRLPQCGNSHIIVCAGGVASNEICNGVDDDCNGQVDEGNVCLSSNSLPSSTATTALVTPTSVPTSAGSPTLVPTATFVASATSTVTRTATVTSTSTQTFTPTRTSTRTSTSTSTPTRTPTRTATPTSTPTLACKPANNAGNDNPVGCACLGTFDCCGICGATGTCVGGNRAPAGVDPGAALSCFSQACKVVNNAGSDSPNGCPCIGTFDCCGICSAAGFCVGANRAPAGADPGAAASCS